MADSRDDDKPQYTLYRARPKFLRRRGDDGGLREMQQRAAATEPPKRLRRRRRSGPRRRPRIALWRVAALARHRARRLAAASRSCCSSSPRRSSRAKVSDAADTELGGAGYPLTSPNTILVLGSDARTKDTKEPGANKIGQPEPLGLDPADARRRRPATRRSRSRATRSSTSPATAADKINAAYAIGGPALAIRTVEQYLGIEVNHLVEVNFENFPQLIDALGGIDLPRRLRRLAASTAASRTAATRCG